MDRVYIVDGFYIILDGSDNKTIFDEYDEPCGSISRVPGMGSKPDQWRLYNAHGQHIANYNGEPFPDFKLPWPHD